jgi:two-component system, cell cycle response regulator
MMEMNVLTNAKFEELQTSGRLPSATGVARQIMKLGQQEDLSSNELIRVIKADPALSARLVKAANRGVNTTRRAVASVPDAVLVLGLRAVRHLAMGFSLISNHSDGLCRGFDYAGFWARSLGTAVAFCALATRVRTVPPEEAFVCGLLARMGMLALSTLYPEEYSAVLEDYRAHPEVPLTQLERDTFAIDHNALTAALLNEWGLPRSMVDAACHFESPERCGFPPGSREQAAARALHFAARVGDLCLGQEEERTVVYPTLRLQAAQLGLDGEASVQLLDEIAKEWVEWGRILDLDSMSVPLIDDAAVGARRSSDQPSPADEGEPVGRLRVLVVDDDPAVLIQLKNMLAAEGHAVATASNGREALDLALQVDPQVIVTDWVMPYLDGVSLCKALRETMVGRGIYVVVLTTFDDVARLVEAFDSGADDYLRKPVSARVLTARLRAGQRVLQLHEELAREREDMRRFAADLAIANRRFREAALTDSLTGFPNRRYILERVEQEWASARRTGRAFSCLLLDIDHFKQVNDTYGHDMGDKVLRHTAEVLKRSARGHDTIARIGGEEFLVLLPDTTEKGALICAERLRAAVERSVFVAGALSLSVTVSIGLSVWHSGLEAPEALIKAADQAVYAAKQAGRNRVCVAGRAACATAA